MRNVRRVINDIMNDVFIKNIALNISLDKRVGESGLKANDIGLLKEEVTGTIRNLIRIDYIIRKYNTIKKVDIEVLNILRTSVYEILFLDKIPEHATCNEAVKLTKEIKKKSAANFVNAVLRNVLRAKYNVALVEKTPENMKEYLSVYYSLPEWLVEKWLDDYSVDDVEAMAKSFLEERDITILVNTLNTTKEELKVALEDLGVTLEEGKYISSAYNAKNLSNIKKIKAFKKGEFYIQDESSMIASKTLNAKNGEEVLDICAAPGGKSIYACIASGNNINVIARDKTRDKVKLIKDNIKRLKLTNIKAEAFDATVYDEKLKEKFDKIIVDVPCSGLGLLNKKPDIKYNVSGVQIDELIEIQRQIFANAVKYLKVGGELIYTTCTINKDENQKNVEYFLSNERDYKVEMVSISDLLPDGIEEDEKGMVQILPHVHHIDGFFISKMKKVW